MIEQRERRRLMEEAAITHAAKVRRRRILIGVPVAFAVAAAALLAYLEFGGGPLKGAAERAEERTARLRFSFDGGAPGSTTSFSGEYVTTGDNERFTGDGTFTLDDEGAEPATVRKIGDRMWVRTKRADAQPGRPWVRLPEADAPWAPAHVAQPAREPRARASGGA